MATLTFSFETGAIPVSRIVDAFALKFDYAANKIGAETQASFARRMVKQFIVDVVKDEDSKAAARTIPPVNEIVIT